MFGPKTEFIEEGVDPLAPPRKRKYRIPYRWIVIGAISVVTILFLSIGGLAYKAFAKPDTPTPTATELLPPAMTTLAAQFPIGEQTSIPSAQLTPVIIEPTKLTAYGLLTQFANGTIVPDWTATATAENFLTQQVHDDLNMTATIAALGIG